MQFPSLQIPDDVSPELRLLLLCAVAQGMWEEAADAAEGVADWRGFFELARGHRLLAAVHHAFSVLAGRALLPAGVPDWLTDELRLCALSLAARSTSRTQALCMFQHLLGANGVTAVAIKGPALGLQAFGDVARRQFDDLDCIVPKGSMLRVNDILTGAGYVRARPAGDCSLRAYAATRQEWVFGAPGTGVLFDLKELPVAHCTARPQLTDFILGSTVRLPVRHERSILAASPEPMLLVLCLHGVHELWPKLSQVADIVGLVAGTEQLDWEKVREQAERLGRLRALLVGLGLARQLGNAAAPPWVEEKIAADRPCRELIEQATHKLFAEPATERPPLHRERYELKTLQRLRDKARFVVRQTFVPGHNDLEKFPRAARVFPLLYLLRPCRRLALAVRMGLGRG